jgi:hypothetical protein
MTPISKWSETRRSTQLHSSYRGRRAASALRRTTAVCLLLCACAAPEAERSEGEPPTRRLLLIGIDGVRLDVLAEVSTPNLDALAAEGTMATTTRTTTPSVSGPSWSSMLTGVWPAKHGVTDNEFGGRRYEGFPGFLTLIERVRPDMVTFAVADWVPLMQLEGGSTVLGPEIDRRELLDGYELGWAEADERGTDLAVDELQSGDPDAMFVYLGNPDEVSHATGAIGIEYREAIAQADLQVGRLVEALRARPTYESELWLVMVSTDHGRRADGGHGGDSPEEMTTFIIAAGPGVRPPAEGIETSIVDVAVTALTHLEIPIDPAWALDGRAFGLN